MTYFQSVNVVLHAGVSLWQRICVWLQSTDDEWPQR